jgi:hypothetical protein
MLAENAFSTCIDWALEKELTVYHSYGELFPMYGN